MKLNTAFGPRVLDSSQLLSEGNVLANLGNSLRLGVSTSNQEVGDDLSASGLTLLVKLCIADIVEEGCEFDQFLVHGNAILHETSADIKSWSEWMKFVCQRLSIVSF